ncbi:MAG TPA: 1-deoxy-D-xylulose-5-phosphate synthase [Gemmatimonadota bacterium]|nr:1-deoxy-D-xylulose-5-phosphate synthase [Gemmatimonadota bacterium]
MRRLLDRIEGPDDLKGLSREALHQLVGEVRERVLDIVARRGGHLGAPLGVVELTVALHTIYDSPRDRIIWDVGHQCYPHKILTGRNAAMDDLRQADGPSGFCRISESPHDVFGAGHASTSISAALGIATARDLAGEDFKVVTVTGDGAMTAGLAYEGLNNAGAAERDLLVILNDNQMSIAPNLGAMHNYLTGLLTNPLYNRIRTEIWDLTGRIPRVADEVRSFAHRVEESVKALVTPGVLFEELGFRYFGPIDGHNLDDLIDTLQRIKDLRGPQMLHIRTVKGKGYPFAEADQWKYHGVGAINLESGKVEGPPSKPKWTKVFSSALVEMGRRNDRVVAVTAAMPDGAGVQAFLEAFPDRGFDVGIAEQHAVTFAGGLALQGYVPVCAIYSTFLQRAYDQIVHDVCIQDLPVVFVLDRAGLVGNDGPTHMGAYDVAYLSVLPNMIVAAPMDEHELQDLLHTAIRQREHPFALRYPRDTIGPDVDLARTDFRFLPIGRWEVVREGADVCILAVGTMVKPALAAADQLVESGLEAQVVNCRYLKPMDEDLLTEVGRRYERILTVEESAVWSGFGANVARLLAERGFHTDVRCLGLPDRVIDHAPRSLQLEACGLTPAAIARVALAMTAPAGRPSR